MLDDFRLGAVIDDDLHLRSDRRIDQLPVGLDDGSRNVLGKRALDDRLPDPPIANDDHMPRQGNRGGGVVWHANGWAIRPGLLARLETIQRHEEKWIGKDRQDGAGKDVVAPLARHEAEIDSKGRQDE